MPDISEPAAANALPVLPHWDTTPEDPKRATREIKAALRARIAASGRSVEEVFAVIERRVAARVQEIEAAKHRGECVWPVTDYADIEAGETPVETLALLRRRGCLVVRGHFPREKAPAWDREIVEYVESNRFFEIYRGPGDDFFGNVGSRPEIYPNPDRIRRRPPGADSGGLGTHLDPGNLDLWMTDASQKAFRHLFDGSIERYDPWDAAHRTDAPHRLLGPQRRPPLRR